jgi:hypothetical protein
MQKSAGHSVCHGRQVGAENPVNIFFEGWNLSYAQDANVGELSPFADAKSVRQIRMRIVNAWPGKSFASHIRGTGFFSHHTGAVSCCVSDGQLRGTGRISCRFALRCRAKWVAMRA